MNNFDFDVPEEEGKMRECKDPKKLFDIWDRACRAREKWLITEDQWEGVKQVYDRQLQVLKNIQNGIKGAFEKGKKDTNDKSESLNQES